MGVVYDEFEWPESSDEEHNLEDDGVVPGHPTLRFYSPPPSSPELHSPDDVNVSDELGFYGEVNAPPELNHEEMKCTTEKLVSSAKVADELGLCRVRKCVMEKSAPPTTAEVVMLSDYDDDDDVTVVGNDVELRFSGRDTALSAARPPITTADNTDVATEEVQIVGVAAARNDVKLGELKLPVEKSVLLSRLPLPQQTADSSRLCEGDDDIDFTTVKIAEKTQSDVELGTSASSTVEDSEFCASEIPNDTVSDISTEDDVEETENDELGLSPSVVAELKHFFKDYYGGNKRNDRKSKEESSGNGNEAMKYLIQFLRILGEEQEKLNEAEVDDDKEDGNEYEEEDFDVDVVEFAKRCGCTFPRPRCIG